MLIKNKDGEKLLLQGQRLREQAKTFKALDTLNRALAAFIKEKNYSRFAHALLDRAICWQHLYQFNNNDSAFAVLYKKDAEAMLEIVRTKNIQTEISAAYFINGKAQMLFGNYGEAANFFNKALKKLPAHKKAQRGDWLTNLGKAYYFRGKKELGLKKFFEGIEKLKISPTGSDEHTFKVWLSGGYLRLAEMLKKDNPKQSKKYLAQAKAIIKSSPKQIVRTIQLENFIKTGKSGL